MNRQIAFAGMTLSVIMVIGITVPSFAAFPVQGFTDPFDPNRCLILFDNQLPAIEGEIMKNDPHLLKCEATTSVDMPAQNKSPQDFDNISCKNQDDDETLRWQIHINGQGKMSLTCHF